MNNLIEHQKRPPFLSKFGSGAGLILAVAALIAVASWTAAAVQAQAPTVGTIFVAGTDFFRTAGGYTFSKLNQDPVLQDGELVYGQTYQNGMIYALVGDTTETTGSRIVAVSPHTGTVLAEVMARDAALRYPMGMAQLADGKLAIFYQPVGRSSSALVDYRVLTLSADGRSVASSELQLTQLGFPNDLGEGSLARLGDRLYLLYSSGSAWYVHPFTLSAAGGLTNLGSIEDIRSRRVTLPSTSLADSSPWVVGMEVVDGRLVVLSSTTSTSTDYALTYLSPSLTLEGRIALEVEGLPTTAAQALRSMSYAADVEPYAAAEGNFANARLRNWRVSTQTDAVSGSTAVVMRWDLLASADGYEILVLDNGTSENSHRVPQAQFERDGYSYRLARMPGDPLDPADPDSDVLRYLTVQVRAYRLADDGTYTYSVPTETQHVSFLGYEITGPDGSGDWDQPEEDESGIVSFLQSVIDATGMDIDAGVLIVPIWFAVAAGSAAGAGCNPRPNTCLLYTSDAADE